VKKAFAGLLCAALVAVPMFANGALTVVKRFDTPQHMGWFKAMIADITFDSSYDAGGEAITPGMVGLSSIFYATAGSDTARKRLYTVTWDETNSNLMAFVNYARGSADTSGVRATYVREATTSYNLSTLTVRMLFIGR